MVTIALFELWINHIPTLCLWWPIPGMSVLNKEFDKTILELVLRAFLETLLDT